MSRILIAEDEEAIREFVVINLERAGHSVTQAVNGEEALEKFFSGTDFDIVILDIMMPIIDGMEVCRRIRKLNTTVGIIMLTAKSQEADKVSGLMTGADDFVTKPFSPAELVARVATLARRVDMFIKPDSTASIGAVENVSGEFSLNMRRRTLTRGKEELELTPVEYQLLEILFEAKGDTVERNFILKRIWGDTFLGEDKIVDVNIRRLRMKIEEEPSEPRHILTVRGIGYRWKD